MVSRKGRSGESPAALWTLDNLGSGAGKAPRDVLSLVPQGLALGVRGCEEAGASSSMPPYRPGPRHPQALEQGRPPGRALGGLLGSATPPPCPPPWAGPTPARGAHCLAFPALPSSPCGLCLLGSPAEIGAFCGSSPWSWLFVPPHPHSACLSGGPGSPGPALALTYPTRAFGLANTPTRASHAPHSLTFPSALGVLGDVPVSSRVPVQIKNVLEGVSSNAQRAQTSL